MHSEAYEGFGWALRESGLYAEGPWKILDIGGQYVNGSVHDYFSNSFMTTLDLENADIIADATTWEPTELFDVVIATELFEHVQDWRAVIRTMAKALVPKGRFLATCASIGRRPHGVTGALDPAPGEHYANIHPDHLRDEISKHFSQGHVRYEPNPGDAYMWAIR